jgi:hypothetical protein
LSLVAKAKRDDAAVKQSMTLVEKKTKEISSLEASSCVVEEDDADVEE